MRLYRVKHDSVRRSVIVDRREKTTDAGPHEFILVPAASPENFRKIDPELSIPDSQWNVLGDQEISKSILFTGGFGAAMNPGDWHSGEW